MFHYDSGNSSFWKLFPKHFTLCLIIVVMVWFKPISENYSMPQTVWNTENVSKWTSNVQLLCSTASTYWIIYSWLTSNPKISIWVHTRAKIHSFSKCQNSDHFWGCEKSILQIQPDHNETCLLLACQTTNGTMQNAASPHGFYDHKKSI